MDVTRGRAGHCGSSASPSSRSRWPRGRSGAERSSGSGDGSGDGSGAAAGRPETSCPRRKSPPWSARPAGRRGRGGLCRGSVTPGGGGGASSRPGAPWDGGVPVPSSAGNRESIQLLLAVPWVKPGDPPAPREMVAAGLYFHGIRYGMTVWGWKEPGGGAGAARGVRPRSPTSLLFHARTGSVLVVPTADRRAGEDNRGRLRKPQSTKQRDAFSVCFTSG